MKGILLLVGLCALAAAVPPPTKWIPKKHKIADKGLLEKQLAVLRLYRYYNQPLYYKEYVDIAHAYNPETHLDQYTHPEHVKEFMFYYHHTILPKGHIFSIFEYHHLKQAIALFKMFYYAKDYDTFFKTAVWAREYVNEYMWFYSFSVAVIHRSDTHGVVLPPIYEMNPYYFFNSDVIHKAQYYKQIHHGDYPKTEGDYHGYTIIANVSGWYINVEKEQHLSYFTEDEGLHASYYWFHVTYPFWLDADEFHLKDDRKGEMFYAFHQKLYARYNAERLSHNFLPVEPLTAQTSMEAPYYCSLEYPNGLHFPSRPPHTKLNWDTSYHHPHYNFSYSYTRSVDYVRRIRDALSLGYVYTKDGKKVSLYDDKGLEIFASILEGSVDSPNIDYYGILQMYIRHVLGYAPTPLDKDHLVPSVVEHYETSLRDPIYWSFVKWIVDFFQEYKMREPHHHYTKHDLEFPGVKVESLNVDRLITYFDWFYIDLSHAVFYDYKHETEPFHVRAKQLRLNHKPFTYTINVNSDKTVDAVVRVFIGPKYDVYGRVVDFNENRLNFYMIDKFVYHLQAGKNSIIRNSKQTLSVSDRTPYWQLYKRVMGAIKGTEEFLVDGSETHWDIPNRLLLPIGKRGGMPFQFFVIVTPFVKEHSAVDNIPTEHHYPQIGSGLYFYDKHAAGYPFDKPFIYSHLPFDMDNIIAEEVLIDHKGKEESLNVST